MGGIGDFAEMLINQQMAGTSPSVQKTSNVKQRDISRVEVPNDMMRDILSESFDVKVPEQEEVMEETVETTVQPINEDMLFTTKCFVWTSLTSDKGIEAIEKCIDLVKSTGGLIVGAPSISIIKNRFEEDLVDFFAFFGLLIYSFLHTISTIAEVTDYFEAYRFGSIATFIGILFWMVSVPVL